MSGRPGSEGPNSLLCSAGEFDPVSGQEWLRLGMEQVNSPAAQQLNRETSRQSLVLLQNKQRALPFKAPSSGKVVVVGPSANSTRLLGGGHCAPTPTLCRLTFVRKLQLKQFC